MYNHVPTNYFCNINEKHLCIRAPYVFVLYRWLREIALKVNTIRFISIVSVQRQLKWELFY